MPTFVVLPGNVKVGLKATTVLPTLSSLLIRSESDCAAVASSKSALQLVVPVPTLSAPTLPLPGER